MACMAQSVETEHGTMKEDREPRILTHSSRFTHTQLLQEGLQLCTRTSTDMGLQPHSALCYCGTLSKSPTISEPQVLHVQNGEKKNLPLLSCVEGYVKKKIKCLVWCLEHSRHSTKGGEYHWLEVKLHRAGSMATGLCGSRRNAANTC